MSGNELIKRLDGVTDGQMRRVEILRRADGMFQFVERSWQAPAADDPNAANWATLHRSGLYETLDEAESESRTFLARERPDRFKD
jgi:hypothetical protein